MSEEQTEYGYAAEESLVEIAWPTSAESIGPTGGYYNVFPATEEEETPVSGEWTPVDKE